MVGLILAGIAFALFEVIGTKYRKWWTVSQGFARLRHWNRWVADGSFVVIVAALVAHLVFGQFNQITP